MTAYAHLVPLSARNARSLPMDSAGDAYGDAPSKPGERTAYPGWGWWNCSACFVQKPHTATEHAANLATKES